MPNNLDIDCVAGYFAQLLTLFEGSVLAWNLARRGPCNVRALRANLQARGVVKAFVFELFGGMFLQMQSDYKCSSGPFHN